MSNSNTFDVVLLMALPASGKSEVRNFLAHIDPERLQEEFHFGPTLQLDDFPYVDFMRKIDNALASLGEERFFYVADDQPFIDGRDWGTLTKLLSEDYHDLLNSNKVLCKSKARFLFDRIDRAAEAVGLPARLSLLSDDILSKAAEMLEADAGAVIDGKESQYTDTLEGKTIVIECARGGKDGSEMPLTGTEGYQYYFTQLAPDLLSHAAALYIQVTPEESRRKNFARYNPDDPSSNLFHGTPLAVMMRDYGCDDITWLAENSEVTGIVTVKQGTDNEQHIYYLPLGIFDNREDLTTFLREDASKWDPVKVETITKAVKQATDLMWSNYRK